MEYRELKPLIGTEISKHLEELTALSDDLFDHPEVSGQEYRSSQAIVALLQRHGYAVEYPYAGIPTAFRAVYGGNCRKYKIAVLVEYDALETIGHACGHCLSGSISILAALALREVQDALDADIHLIGTPLEETEGAKCKMAEQGVFSGYDMAVLLHMYDANLVAPKLQALACYQYTFHGKAAHASSAPWKGRNALNGVQLMFHAVDMMRQHTRGDAQFHGVVRKGGEMPNTVPEEASAEFFIRALDRTYLQELIKLVDDCAEGASIATQTTWEKCATAEQYADLKNNATGIAALREVYGELELPLNGDPDKIFASSDAGNVSYVCPTFHPCLQVVDRGVALHTKEFAQNMKSPRAHQGLETGAKIIAYLIAKIFSDEETVRRMKADFAAEA